MQASGYALLSVNYLKRIENTWILFKKQIPSDDQTEEVERLLIPCSITTMLKTFYITCTT